MNQFCQGLESSVIQSFREIEPAIGLTVFFIRPNIGCEGWIRNIMTDTAQIDKIISEVNGLSERDKIALFYKIEQMFDRCDTNGIFAISKKKSIKELQGKIEFREDYDYKAMRN